MKNTIRCAVYECVKCEHIWIQKPKIRHGKIILRDPIVCSKCKNLNWGGRRITESECEIYTCGKCKYAWAQRLKVLTSVSKSYGKTIEIVANEPKTCSKCKTEYWKTV